LAQAIHRSRLARDDLLHLTELAGSPMCCGASTGGSPKHGGARGTVELQEDTPRGEERRVEEEMEPQCSEQQCACAVKASQIARERGLALLVGPYSSSVIPKKCITSSSQYGDFYEPEQCRMDSDRGWAPKSPGGSHEWLQVDLGCPKRILWVLTASRYDDIPEFVKEFKLSHSLDGVCWEWHPETFMGETRSGGDFRESCLRPPIKARMVRLHPTEWKFHSNVRLELLGRALTAEEEALGNDTAEDETLGNETAEGDLEPSAAYPGGAYPPLASMVAALKKDLAVDGNMTEVVARACEQLGISTDGLSMKDQAKRCYDHLYGDSK